MTKTWTDFSISSILEQGSCRFNTKSRPNYFTFDDVLNVKDDHHTDTESLTKNQQHNHQHPSSPDEDQSSNSSISPPATRKKKSRTVFTRQQIQHLENAFDRKKYFTNSERQRLASDLLLSETQVKIWLQNRRNKWKKQLQNQPHATATSPPSFSTFTSSHYNKILQHHHYQQQQRYHHVTSPSLLPRSPVEAKLPESVNNSIFSYDRNEKYYLK